MKSGLRSVAPEKSRAIWPPGVRGDIGGGGSVARRGTGDDGIDGTRVNEGDGGGIVGVRGAMRPSDLSSLRGRKGMAEKRDLAREVGAVITICDWTFGLGDAVALSATKFKSDPEKLGLNGKGVPVVGRALSPALRLRNKNKGASHTHTPKNVAMSANPGAGLPLRYAV